MSKALTVFQTLQLISLSSEPLAFRNVDTGRIFETVIEPGTTKFVGTGLTSPIVRAAYIAINGHCAMESVETGQVEAPPAAVDRAAADSEEFPGDDETLAEWIADPETPDALLQEYTVEILGETRRKRSRESNIEKINEYLSQGHRAAPR